jgi:LPXTG-motif cell wall-anchored protein
LVLGDSSSSAASAQDDLGTVATAAAGSSTALTTAGDLGAAASSDDPGQAAPAHAAPAPAAPAANGDQPMLPHTGPTTSDAVTTGIAGLLALLGLAAAAIRRKVNAA